MYLDEISDPAVTAPVADGMFRIEPCTYALRSALAGATSPAGRVVVGSVMWAESREMAIALSHRVKVPTQTVGRECAIPETLIGYGGGTYGAMLDRAADAANEEQWIESEVGSADGDFEVRSLRRDRVTYYFRPGASREDRPVGIVCVLPLPHF
jgi:hypothetical protein